MTAAAATTRVSKLLNQDILDPVDKLDAGWSSQYDYLYKKVLSATSDSNETQRAVLKQAISYPSETCVALLYGILTSSNNGNSAYFKYLAAIMTEHGKSNDVMTQMERLVSTKYSSVKVSCRSQILWLTREWIVRNFTAVDTVIKALCRQVTGGRECVSSQNTWLIKTLVEILSTNWKWVKQQSALLPFLFQTFIRASLDHSEKPLLELRHAESSLCYKIWKEHAADITSLGRELVRLLHDAKENPIFQRIWKELRSRRDDDSTSDVTISKLMSIKTSRTILSAQLTPEMEEPLRFIMSKVPLENQNKHQSWFQQKFLGTSASESLIPDLVRYVCCVYHPKSAGPDIVPRWAVLEWLIKCCTRPEIQARMNLAMFIDILYYDKDDIYLNIEPTMTLMRNSASSHSEITLSLLQYLVFAVEKFAASPLNCSLMLKGTKLALDTAILASKEDFGAIVKMDAWEKLPNVKKHLQKLFPKQFAEPSETATKSPTNNNTGTTTNNKSSTTDTATNSTEAEASTSTSTTKPNAGTTTKADTSTTIDDSEVKDKVEEVKMMEVEEDTTVIEEKGTFLTDTSSEPETILSAPGSPSSSTTCEMPVAHVPSSLNKIQSEALEFARASSKCTSLVDTTVSAAMVAMLQAWIKLPYADEVGGEIGTLIQKALDHVLLSTMWIHTVTSCPSVLHVLFKFFFEELPPISASNQKQLQLAAPLFSRLIQCDVSISLKLLSYSIASACVKNADVGNAMALYFGVSEALYNRDVSVALVTHLTQSPTMDIALAVAQAAEETTIINTENFHVNLAMSTLIPFLNTMFPKLLVGKEPIVRFIATNATPSMLQVISNRVALTEFAIFGTRGANIVLASFQWESYAQRNGWELLCSELMTLSAQSVQPIWRKLFACMEPQESPEVLNGLLKLLSLHAPEKNLVQAVLKLPSSFGLFSETCLNQWSKLYSTIMTEFVTTTLSNALSRTDPPAETLSLLQRAVKVNTGVKTTSVLPLLSLLQQPDIVKIIVSLQERAPFKSIDLSLIIRKRALSNEPQRPAKKARLE